MAMLREKNEPTRFEELVPPSVPKDPLTGEPLHYKISDTNSVLIYGGGWDQKDDGGAGVSGMDGFSKLVNQADWGVLVNL